MSIVDLLVGLVIAVGLIGIIVPVLPGSVLIGGAIVFWAYDASTTGAWVAAAVACAILIAGAVVKFTIPSRKLAASGVPRRTLALGVVAAVVGFFVIPVIGFFVGFVAGVYLAEWQRVGSSSAWPSSKAALKAVGVSIMIELSAATLAAGVWLVAVVLT